MIETGARSVLHSDNIAGSTAASSSSSVGFDSGCAVFNPLSWGRTELVTLPPAVADSAAAFGPSQRAHSGEQLVVARGHSLGETTAGKANYTVSLGFS